MSSDLHHRLGPLLLAESPCLVAVIDSTHRLIFTNSVFQREFGQREGDTCYHVYRGRDEPCDNCPVDEVFVSGKPTATEEEVVGPDGSPRILGVQVVPLPAEDPDRVEQVVQIGIDNTRQHDLQQALEQAERLANVGLTTAGLAHTIKNILAGLEGGIYVVNSAMEKDDADRLKGGWAMVERYIEQVTALVRNLLRYAKAQEPVREETAPADLVDRVIELYASKAELCSVELETRVEPGLPPLVVDGEAMHACLTNLVTNALDACAWDPEVDKEHRIIVEARSSDAGVLFEVRDNGMGIALEDQRKILNKLFTTKGIRGTGLGLLLTKKAVEEHGGTISFQSAPGQGTTFQIELPRTSL